MLALGNDTTPQQSPPSARHGWLDEWTGFGEGQVPSRVVVIGFIELFMFATFAYQRRPVSTKTCLAWLSLVAFATVVLQLYGHDWPVVQGIENNDCLVPCALQVAAQRIFAGVMLWTLLSVGSSDFTNRRRHNVPGLGWISGIAFSTTVTRLWVTIQGTLHSLVLTEIALLLVWSVLIIFYAIFEKTRLYSAYRRSAAWQRGRSSRCAVVRDTCALILGSTLLLDILIFEVFALERAAGRLFVPALVPRVLYKPALWLSALVVIDILSPCDVPPQHGNGAATTDIASAAGAAVTVVYGGRVPVDAIGSVELTTTTNATRNKTNRRISSRDAVAISIASDEYVVPPGREDGGGGDSDSDDYDEPAEDMSDASGDEEERDAAMNGEYKRFDHRTPQRQPRIAFRAWRHSVHMFAPFATLGVWNTSLTPAECLAMLETNAPDAAVPAHLSDLRMQLRAFATIDPQSIVDVTQAVEGLRRSFSRLGDTDLRQLRTSIARFIETAAAAAAAATAASKSSKQSGQRQPQRHVLSDVEAFVRWRQTFYEATISPLLGRTASATRPSSHFAIVVGYIKHYICAARLSDMASARDARQRRLSTEVGSLEGNGWRQLDVIVPFAIGGSDAKGDKGPQEVKQDKGVIAAQTPYFTRHETALRALLAQWPRTCDLRDEPDVGVMNLYDKVTTLSGVVAMGRKLGACSRAGSSLRQKTLVRAVYDTAARKRMFYELLWCFLPSSAAPSATAAMLPLHALLDHAISKMDDAKMAVAAADVALDMLLVAMHCMCLSDNRCGDASAMLQHHARETLAGSTLEYFNKTIVSHYYRSVASGTGTATYGPRTEHVLGTVFGTRLARHDGFQTLLRALWAIQYRGVSCARALAACVMDFMSKSATADILGIGGGDDAGAGGDAKNATALPATTLPPAEDKAAAAVAAVVAVDNAPLSVTEFSALMFAAVNQCMGAMPVQYAFSSAVVDTIGQDLALSDLIASFRRSMLRTDSEARLRQTTFCTLIALAWIVENETGVNIRSSVRHWFDAIDMDHVRSWIETCVAELQAVSPTASSTSAAIARTFARRELAAEMQRVFASVPVHLCNVWANNERDVVIV